MKMANAPSWSPLPYASNAGPTCWRKASPLGTESSDGSSRISVCTISGWSSASWAAIRRAGGVAGDVGARHSQMVEERRGVGGVVATLTGGGVWVLPTQPRLWYRISW